MFTALQVLAAIVVAIASAAALGHALELPGKLRLTKEEYLAVQPIYYPGFTIAGISEPAGLLILIVLAAFTPAGSASFWLTLGALVALGAVVAIYWLVTHPVNNFWLGETQLAGASKRFFAIGAGESPHAADWKAPRDRWEYSHVARAAFAFLSLLLLVTAIAIA